MRKRVVTRLEILIAGDALVATLNAQDRFANPQTTPLRDVIRTAFSELKELPKIAPLIDEIEGLLPSDGETELKPNQPANPNAKANP